MDSISVYTDDNIDSFKTDKLIEIEMQMEKQKQKMETKNSFNNGFSRRSGGNGGDDPQNSNTNIDFHDDDVDDKTITELMTTDVAAENVEPDQLYMDDGAAVDEIERPTTVKSTEKLTNQKYVDDDDDEPEIRVSKLTCPCHRSSLLLLHKFRRESF